MRSLLKASRSVLLNEGATPKYGCLMAMVSGDESQNILDTFQHIVNPSDLHENGYETEPHVTVLYGFNLNFDGNQLQDFCAPYLPIKAHITGISKFTCPEYDVVKFDIYSGSLVKLNQKLKDKFGSEIAPSNYPDYHPHLTVAYVRSGAKFNAKAAEQLIGHDFTFNSLLYSLPEKQGRISIS